MVSKEKTREFIDSAYRIACEHGFHDNKELSREHHLMLVLTEVCEALEAHRKGRFANLKSFDSLSLERTFDFRFKSYVKDTLEDELADICIRLYDFCGAFEIDPILLKEDDIREMFHVFDKYSFTERCFALSMLICDAHAADWEVYVGQLLDFVYALCDDMGIDLERHIELKMRYNAGRARMHGKKY